MGCLSNLPTSFTQHLVDIDFARFCLTQILWVMYLWLLFDGLGSLCHSFLLLRGILSGYNHHLWLTLIWQQALIELRITFYKAQHHQHVANEVIYVEYGIFCIAP